MGIKQSKCNVHLNAFKMYGCKMGGLPLQIPGLGLSVGVTSTNPDRPSSMNYTVTESDTRATLQEIFCYYNFVDHPPSPSTFDVPPSCVGGNDFSRRPPMWAKGRRYNEAGFVYQRLDHLAKELKSSHHI